MQIKRESNGIYCQLKTITLLLMIITLTALLFIGPFYRGLFFTKELLVAQAIVFGLLIVWGIYRLASGRVGLLKSPLDICLLALFLAYFISFFVAAHKRDALEQMLKIAMYLVVYLVSFELSISKIWPLYREKSKQVSEESNSLPPSLNLILHLALAAAVVVTIASIGAAAGHWNILGAYQDAGLRIASPLGYSNTAAAYLMAAYFLTIGLASSLGSNWWKRSLYLLPASLILTTTILTFSRGAWLLLPPLVILMILASAPGMRLRSALLMAATSIPAIPAAFLADPLFRSSSPASGWIPIVLAMFAAFLLGALFEFFMVQKYRARLILGTAVLAAVLIIIIFIFVIPLFNISSLDAFEPEGQESLSVEERLDISLSRILPERYHNRIFTDGRDRNLNARLEMFRDAIKIIRDYPLLGTGGGGFKALYQGYQESIYYSTEVHNHFLQVWVEAGVIGFLAFLGIWLSLALAFIRNCVINKAPANVWQKWATVFVPVAALGAHSVIDWNFSLAAVGIYLFVLLGASKSLDQIVWFNKDRSLKNKDRKQGKWTGIVAITIGALLLIYTLVLIKGFFSTWRSQMYLEQGNLKQAVVELGQAIRYDPLRAENYFNLSVLFDDLARSTGDRTELQQLVYLSQRAHELEPKNPIYVYRYGELLLNFVDPQAGIEIIDQVTELRPLEINSYLQAGWIRLQLIEFYMSSGNYREAEKYFSGLETLEQKMFDNLNDSRPLAFIMGRAFFLNGDYEQAKNYFSLVPESDGHYQSAQEHLNAISDNH